MTDLIERLERADGPSWELFQEAWLAVHHDGYGLENERDTCRLCERFNRMLDAEAWTDAALMLVPDGWTGFVAVDADNETWLWSCNSAIKRGFRIAHKIPAIALCIATLKAKDADNG